MKTLYPLAIAVWLATLAMTSFDYWVYPVTRFIVSGSAIYYWLSFETERRKLSIIMGIIALIFNPLIPLHLGRDAWQWVDGVTALIFLASIPTVPKASEAISRNRKALIAWTVTIAIIALPVFLFVMAARENLDRNKPSYSEKAKDRDIETILGRPLISEKLDRALIKESYPTREELDAEMLRRLYEEAPPRPK